MSGTAEAPSAPPRAPSTTDEEVKIHEILHGIKIDGKKSLWATTLETMHMADGKSKKDDVCVDTVEVGLHMMKGLVETKLKEDEDDDRSDRYKFDLTPMKDFDASLDDLLTAFVKWSFKEESNDYNISKAFRRLDSYASWMEANRAVLSKELSDAIKKEAHAMLPMKLTFTQDKTLVWWIDMASIKNKDIKAYDHDLTLLYFVWVCHAVLFKSETLVLVENLEKVGMFQLFTMIPADLSAKLDRLTIGVLPLKMKAIYLLHNPRWMSIMLTLMKPFLSKKMRQRMIAVKDKDTGKVITDVIGLEATPKGFCGIEGLVEQDEFDKILASL